MPFKKLEKQPISDRVYEALRQEILDGAFRPGDKLPSEAKLSAELGVSKSSVKVAIQRLCTLGLVETRPGDGSYIREFNANRYLNQMFEFLLSDRDINHITEYRMYMEMACTRLAIRKATPEDFACIEEILWKMEDAIRDGDIVGHGKWDYQYHLAIWKATHNDIFVLNYEVIGKMLRQHATILNEGFFKKIKGQKVGDDVHWRLYRAIKAGDLALCRRCYAEMFSVFEPLPEEMVQDC